MRYTSDPFIVSLEISKLARRRSLSWFWVKRSTARLSARLSMAATSVSILACVSSAKGRLDRPGPPPPRKTEPPSG